ncbi:MAG TPA: hypothetical protein V6D13_04965 [Halomicronema sp.]
MDITVPVRTLVRQNPLLFYPICRAYFPPQNLTIVQQNTQIVIEGFPRCANTFAVIAFFQSQPEPVKIAHHLHAPAQIIRAAEWKIPALVLLRNPKDAVLSCITAFPKYSIYRSLSYYISFYSAIIDYQNSYIIGEFEEVTQNYSQVIKRVNAKFNTSFALWKNTPANKEKVYKIMGGKLNTSFPSKHLNIKNESEEERRKKIIEEIQSKKYAPMLEEANQIYQIFKTTALSQKLIDT